MWNIYILRCNDDTLYIGITNNIERRLKEHASGKRGAKYLKGRQPFSLVFFHQIQEKGQALKLEHHLKKLPKDKKEYFLSNPNELRDFIDIFIAE
jgi:putative endonuclease|tara:strand:- start:45 stop:329 length:285 start_codon:yes stop_codon:yes gene_type:complete